MEDGRARAAPIDAVEHRNILKDLILIASSKSWSRLFASGASVSTRKEAVGSRPLTQLGQNQGAT